MTPDQAHNHLQRLRQNRSNERKPATSATPLTISTGTQTLTIQAKKPFQVGRWIEARSGTATLIGKILSYTGTSLVVNVAATGGSGTHANWTIQLVGPTKRDIPYLKRKIAEARRAISYLTVMVMDPGLAPDQIRQIHITEQQYRAEMRKHKEELEEEERAAVWRDKRIRRETELAHRVSP
jgi:hypothetical protein